MHTQELVMGSDKISTQFLCVLFCLFIAMFRIHVIYSSISFKITSMALEQSYDCSGANEVTLQDLGPASLFDKTSYTEIPWSLEATRFSDWWSKLLHRFVIWQAHQQQYSQGACQISERSDNSKYTSPSFQDFTRSYNKKSYRILKQGPGWNNPNNFCQDDILASAAIPNE